MLEAFPLVRRRHPSASQLDSYHAALAARARRGFDRVDQQIEQHLAQRIGVTLEDDLLVKDLKTGVAALDLISEPGSATDFVAGVRKGEKDGTTEKFPVNHTMSQEQIEWFKAGSALNSVAKGQKK